MKENLPYKLLLVLAVAVGGLAILYNTVLRESYATTLWYEYPAVESPQVQREAPDPAEVPPMVGGDVEHAVTEAYTAEQPSLTSVRFPLNINTATEEQLKYIPRVGDVMSRRIIQYREELGGYTDLEQLRSISGVGDSTYELLWSYLYIAGEEHASPVEDTE